MFPVVLDLAGRTVLVVGYGPVGRRKAAAALAAGAAVRVVEPRENPGTAAAGLTVVCEAYRANHLDGAALVFACGPAAVNARVVADSLERGLWVNSASDPSAGTFTLPAVARFGGLTVGVDTGGASPALARRVRDRLAGQLDPALADWVSLLNEIRTWVLASVPDPDRRRALLDQFADWPWLDRVRAEGVEAVRAAVRGVLVPVVPVVRSGGPGGEPGPAKEV